MSNPIIYKFFKGITNTERRLTGWYFLALAVSLTFKNTGTTNKTFQQCGKQDFFRHLLQSSASIYEKFSSHTFGTTTGIQSGHSTHL